MTGWMISSISETRSLQLLGIEAFEILDHEDAVLAHEFTVEMRREAEEWVNRCYGEKQADGTRRRGKRTDLQKFLPKTEDMDEEDRAAAKIAQKQPRPNQADFTAIPGEVARVTKNLPAGIIDMTMQ